MNRYKIVIEVLVFAVYLMLPGCQSPDAATSATPSNWMQTQDIAALRPLLFTREDLGWTDGSYREEMTNLLNRDYVPADDVAEVYLLLNPPIEGPKGYYKKGSILGAGQTVWVYPDEATAMQSIEAERERFSIVVGESMGVKPRLNNVITGCRQARDPEIGNYYNCNFMGQHGRYLTTVNMTVDEKEITFEDWTTLINAIQDRLIAQVGMEGNSP